MEGAQDMPSLFPGICPASQTRLKLLMHGHGGPMMGDRMMYGRTTGLGNHIIHDPSVHASLCVSYSNTEDLNSDVEGFSLPEAIHPAAGFQYREAGVKSDPPDGARAAVDGRDKEEERDVAGT